MPLVLRSTKGTPLTFTELDGNFTFLSQSIVSNQVVSPSQTSVAVFYVQKLYSGSISSSWTDINTYSSPNTDYNTQLSLAKMNSALYPYPDPYSARVAASTALATGNYSTAIINVTSPTVWTVGDSTPSNNGSSDGTSGTSTYADLGFNSTLASVGYTSLLANNVYYNWCKGSGLRLINKVVDMPIFCSSGSDATINSGFYGQGNFTVVYGEANGIAGRLALIDNAGANVVFNADQIVANMYDPLNFVAFDQVDLNVRSFRSYNSNIITAESRRVMSDAKAKPQFNATFDHIAMSDRQSLGIGDYYSDYWYGINIGGASSFGGLFDVKIGNYFHDSAVRGNSATYTFSVTNTNGGVDINTMKNSDINISIDNLYQRFDDSSNTYAGFPFGSSKYSIANYFTSAYTGSYNSNVSINIKNAHVEGYFGNRISSPGYSGTNCKVKFKCDNCLRYFTTYSGAQPSIYLSNYAGTETGNKNSGIVYEGSFSNQSGSVVYTDYTYQTGLVNKHVFTGIFKNQTSGSASPVFYFPVTNVVSVALKDVVLMTNTSSLAIDTTPGHYIYTQNVVSNVTASANVVFEPQGLNVLTNMENYIL